MEYTFNLYRRNLGAYICIYQKAVVGKIAHCEYFKELNTFLKYQKPAKILQCFILKIIIPACKIFNF